MVTRLVTPVLAVLLFFLPQDFLHLLQSQPTQVKNGAPQVSEAAIRQLVQDYVTARKTADPNKLKSLFTLDADQLVSTGEWRRGRVDLVNGTVASSRKEGGNRSIDVEWIRFIKEDVALVDARYEVTATGRTPRHMQTTLLCQRENGAWKIAAIRNMLPVVA